MLTNGENTNTRSGGLASPNSGIPDLLPPLPALLLCCGPRPSHEVVLPGAFASLPPTTPSRFCIGLRAGEVLWAAVPGSQQSPGWQQGNSATQGSPMSLGCWSDPCGKVWMELAGDRRPGPGKVGELCSLSGWRGEIRTASWQRWAWPACLT